MKKRIISNLLACCIVLTILPTTVAAAGDYPDYNVKDTLKWSLTTMDGEKINESTYAGILFVFCSCPNSAGAVQMLASSEWISNDDIKVIVIFDDESTMENKRGFIKGNAPNNNNIVFAYGEKSGTMRNYYVRNTLTNVKTYGIGFVVDKNNIIRRAIESCDYYGAHSFFNSAINDYLYKIEQKGALTFDINGTFDYDEAYNVFTELNALRGKLGLSPLTLDAKLTDAATQRAAENSIYYSHTRPNGMDPFTVFPPGGAVKAENIAAGQRSAGEVMNGWSNSPGHYKNMTLDNIDSVGIGCFYQEDGKEYWVQLFEGGRKASQENRKGKEARNAEITALGSNLDIKVVSSSSDISVNDTQKYELCNTNKGNSNLGNTRIIPKVYYSSDTSVATVDSNGLVKGIKGGSAWIGLYALWSPENCFIRFDLQGGTGPLHTQVVSYGIPAKLTILTPTRPGYVFLGWATAKDAATAEYQPGDFITIKNTKLTFYALWKKAS